MDQSLAPLVVCKVEDIPKVNTYMLMYMLLHCRNYIYFNIKIPIYFNDCTIRTIMPDTNSNFDSQ